MQIAEPPQIATPSHTGERSAATWPVLCIAALDFLFHMLTAGRYGIFRDELYYLACSQHLSWGYVDQPPLIALIAWFARHVFGESLYGLRLLPALAGAVLVWLAAKLAREMGGGMVAQCMAALAVFVAPMYMIFHHWLTMNAFEPLFWMGCVWCVLRIIDGGGLRYWILLGVLAGPGLENKYSMLFFLGAMLIALMASSERHVLKGRGLWVSIGIAVLLSLPNVIWQVSHHFPFLELMHNIRSGHRDIVRGPLAFIADQAQIMNPVSAVLWGGGLLWLLMARRARKYRFIGYCFIAVVALFIALKAKNYYVAPVYPMMFAAGGVAIESLAKGRRRSLVFAYMFLLVGTGAILAPMFAPILSPTAFLRYQHRLGLEPVRAENQPTGPLPQYFADEFGWDDMAREAARAYHSLTPEQQAKTVIYAENYGDAGAVDFYGPKYGLPRVVCAHQSYWLWGPRQYTGESMLLVGSDGEGLGSKFRSYRVIGHVTHPYSRLDEHFDLYLAEGLKWDLQTIWPKFKHWG